jgi:hypothetical protein
MARKPMSLNAAQKAEVETLAAVLTSEQIADFFGIARRTFYSLMERDEDIAARYKKGRARAIGAIAQTLITKAHSGDTIAMLFYLKTQGGWREADRDPRVLDAEPVTPLEVRVLASVTDIRVTRGSDG